MDQKEQDMSNLAEVERLHADLKRLGAENRRLRCELRKLTGKYIAGPFSSDGKPHSVVIADEHYDKLVQSREQILLELREKLREKTTILEGHKPYLCFLDADLQELGLL